MVDWTATVVFVAGSTCFTMAISFGGIVYAWRSGTEIALWTVSGVLLVVTILLSILHPGVSKDNRLYPAHFFKRAVLMNMQVQVFLSSGVILVSDKSLLHTRSSYPLTPFIGHGLLHTTVLPIRAGALKRPSNINT